MKFSKNTKDSLYRLLGYLFMDIANAFIDKYYADILPKEDDCDNDDSDDDEFYDDLF